MNFYLPRSIHFNKPHFVELFTLSYMLPTIVAFFYFFFSQTQIFRFNFEISDLPMVIAAVAHSRHDCDHFYLHMMISASSRSPLTAPHITVIRQTQTNIVRI